jgi:predicted DNA-binding protein (MmcQ/YjbR family)
MTIDGLRRICMALPGATEDIKWGADLAFSVGGKMFCVVNVEPPHQMSFKCTPDGFAVLIEREGIIPAPYLARAMWVQESELGTVLERRELEGLLRTSYELVVAKLPGSKRPGGTPTGQPKKRSGASEAKPKARANAKPRARVKGR